MENSEFHLGMPLKTRKNSMASKDMNVIAQPKVTKLPDKSTLAAVPRAETAERPKDFANVYSVPAQGGKNGSTPFSLRSIGQKVTKLEIWDDGNMLRGLRMTFEDGTVKLTGTLESKESQFDLSPKESVTSTTLYSMVRGSGAGRAARVELQTDFGQKFMTHANRSNFKGATDVTTGHLIGAFGESGADLDNLGFYLALPEDVEYEIWDVKYDLSALTPATTNPVSLQDQTVFNTSDSVLTTTMTFEHSYSTNRSWTNSGSVTTGVKTTISAGVPLVVNVGVELTTEGTYSFTSGTSDTEQKTESWSVSVQVGPNSSTKVEAVVTEATIDVPYSASLTKFKSDGTKEVLTNQSGIYRGVNVSNFQVHAVKVQ